MQLLEEMPWGDVRRAAHEGAVFLVPVAPLEDHGPHLPAGVDLILSEGFARELGEGLEARVPSATAVMLPPLALGASRLRSLGCLRVRPATLRHAVVELGRELEIEGARRVVFVSAHLAAGHMAALERACHSLSRGRLQAMAPAGRLGYLLFTGKLQARMEESLGRPLTEVEKQAVGYDLHGGAVETSLMLRFRPDLVAEWYRELPNHAVTPEEIMKGLGRSLRTHRGYFGNPALATEDLARALGEAVVGEGVDLLARWVRGEADYADAELGLRRIPWMARDEARAGAMLMGLGAGLLAGFALARAVDGRPS